MPYWHKRDKWFPPLSPHIFDSCSAATCPAVHAVQRQNRSWAFQTLGSRNCRKSPVDPQFRWTWPSWDAYSWEFSYKWPENCRKTSTKHSTSNDSRPWDLSKPCGYIQIGPWHSNPLPQTMELGKILRNWWQIAVCLTTMNVKNQHLFAQINMSF